MQDRRPTRFPVLITAATQEVLQHPAWPHCLKNWQQRIATIRCLIPSSAKVEESHGIYVRTKGEQVMLSEVIEWAVKSLNPLHAQAIVCDPLVVFHAGITQLIQPDWLQRRNMGAAWVATGNAIKIDPEGFGDTFEDEVLRWFAGGANVWQVLQGYVDRAVPMVPGIWSGFFAGLCQRKVTDARYFDVTSLKIVGSAMPPVGDYDPTGFQYFTTNTPVRTYHDLVPVEA